MVQKKMPFVHIIEEETLHSNVRLFCVPRNMSLQESNVKNTAKLVMENLDWKARKLRLSTFKASNLYSNCNRLIALLCSQDLPGKYL